MYSMNKNNKIIKYHVKVNASLIVICASVSLKSYNKNIKRKTVSTRAYQCVISAKLIHGEMSFAAILLFNFSSFDSYNRFVSCK